MRVGKAQTSSLKGYSSVSLIYGLTHRDKRVFRPLAHVVLATSEKTV